MLLSHPLGVAEALGGSYDNTFFNTLGVPFLNRQLDTLKGVGITPEF